VRVRVAGEGRQLAVRNDLAPRDGAQSLDDRALERRVAVEVELDISEGLACAGEVRRDSLGERVR